jgi:hypothetical protein
MASVSVHLDREHQIIEQRVEGVLTLELFDQLEALTQECVQKLDAGSDVRLLVDSRQTETSGLAARRYGIDIFKKHEVAALAFWGAPRVVRVMQHFAAVVLGRSRVRSFRTQEEARSWLLAGRANPQAKDART